MPATARNGQTGRRRLIAQPAVHGPFRCRIQDIIPRGQGRKTLPSRGTSVITGMKIIQEYKRVRSGRGIYGGHGRDSGQKYGSQQG